MKIVFCAQTEVEWERARGDEVALTVPPLGDHWVARPDIVHRAESIEPSAAERLRNRTEQESVCVVCVCDEVFFGHRCMVMVIVGFALLRQLQMYFVFLVC